MLKKAQTMTNRPKLTKELKAKDFLEYYYLKEELVQFCRNNGLPSFGGKQELTERIAYFLDTGKIERASQIPSARRNKKISIITADTLIEENIVCSEVHRAFFKKEIGENFSFNVALKKKAQGKCWKYKKSLKGSNRYEQSDLKALE